MHGRGGILRGEFMNSIKTILIISTLDTKGQETLFMKKIIEERGLKSLVMDVGILGDPYFTPDIQAHKVAEAASKTLPQLVAMKDESRAMGEMGIGAEKLALDLFRNGDFDAAMSLGGTMGTAVALRVFRRLPVGMTKGLVSTVALSHFVTPQNVGTDLIMFQLTADPWGLNRLVRRDLTKAALAMACAVQGDEEIYEKDAPLIAMTTLGGSWLRYAPAVKERLEREGYEVAVFHSPSMQGALMERLIEAGTVSGLLDLCPHEVMTEHCKGLLNSPNRMEAAARMGIPQIVGPGGIGFFPYGSLDELPERFKGRVMRSHNEIASGIQASVEEMVDVAKIIAQKLNRSHGPVRIVIPEQGFFGYDSPGQPLYYPEGRKAFIETLQETLRPEIEFIRMNCHINDPEYAEKVSDIALKLFKKRDKEENDG
jgi:uncharacterized protein (UPF0261 family)